jgi:NAD(P)-dependent dehydrogenase (short-subunit alcohol dehydrogenase family)
MGFQRFEGKLVIVTGAGSGMGAVTARRFRDEGAAVKRPACRYGAKTSAIKPVLSTIQASIRPCRSTLGHVPKAVSALRTSSLRKPD